MKKPPFATLLLVVACAHLLPNPVLAQVGAVPIRQVAAKGKIVTRVSLVVIPVTVRDRSDQMVNTLEAEDFQVIDNGIPQQVLNFEIGGDPLSLVILVETSSRITPLLTQIQKAAIVLAETVVGPDDEAAVVGFNDSVDKLEDFTSNGNTIEKTITQLKLVTDGSKLFDAMAVGVEMLSGRSFPVADTPKRRLVMLILSEPTDVGSEMKLGSVLKQAQLSNVTIYSVGLSTTLTELKNTPKDTTPHPTPPGTFGRAPFPGAVQTPETNGALYGTGNFLKLGERAVVYVKDKVTQHPLQLAATATGGKYIPTLKHYSIENAIDGIGGELHSQYSLSYTPRGTSDIGYHVIKVNVNKEGLKVRSRPGYYSAGPAN
jgi:VWFA-related protein